MKIQLIMIKKKIFFATLFLILFIKSYAQKPKENENYNKNVYSDSIKTKNLDDTKVSIGQAIFGGTPLYNHQKQQSFYILPLIDVFQYNTVEGFVTNLSSSYTKYLSRNRFFSIKPVFKYSFGNNRFQSKASFEYYYNPNRLESITLSGGKFIQPINTINSQDIFINTYSTLLLDRNFLKFYEKTFFNVSHSFSPIKDFLFSSNINWVKYNPLQNLSKLTNKNNDFTSNTPNNNELANTQFETYKALLFKAEVSWQYKYKRIRFRGKFKSVSKHPKLTLAYVAAIPDILKSNLSYQKLSFQLNHTFNYKSGSYGDFYLETGSFLAKKNLSFLDFKHFNSNSSIYTQFELEKFQLLDFFQYSTTNLYLESHYQHHLNGFLLKKIPFMKKTKMQSVFSINYLFTSTEKHYWESGFGIENIFGKIHFDFYTSWRKNVYENSAIRFKYLCLDYFFIIEKTSFNSLLYIVIKDSFSLFTLAMILTFSAKIILIFIYN